MQLEIIQYIFSKLLQYQYLHYMGLIIYPVINNLRYL